MKSNPTRPLQVGSRPITPGLPNPSCPVLNEAKIVLDKAHDLHRAVRRLRRSTQRCLTCPGRADCPTQDYFSQAIDTAIRELRREWGLDRE